jgi:hypothetical protein
MTITDVARRHCGTAGCKREVAVVHSQLGRSFCWVCWNRYCNKKEFHAVKQSDVSAGVELIKSKSLMEYDEKQG